MGKSFLLRIGLFLLCVVALGQVAAAQEAPDNSKPKVSNASPRDLESIQQLMEQMDEAVVARNSSALKYYGVSDLAQSHFELQSKTQITHIAVAPAGALVRVEYTVSREDETPIKSSNLDVWLKRQGDKFIFSSQYWAPPTSPEKVLLDAATQTWKEKPSGILHLIVTRRGGRWIPLRQMSWKGELASQRIITQLKNAQPDAAEKTADQKWIARQLERQSEHGSGTAHLFLQAENDGWIGVGSAWQPDAEAASHTLDDQLKELREQVKNDGFIRASVHRDFGETLAKAKLYEEANIQLEQAQALSPSSVSSSVLAQVQKLSNESLESSVSAQLQNEAKIGLDSTHPKYQITALSRQFSSQPTPLTALRLGVEYSQLGDDTNAARMLQRAQSILASQNRDRGSASDRAWIKVLLDHLQERMRDAGLKPGNLISSSLFTVRCHLDDPNTLPVLAALENAQHTVYANFGIPMGNTEVLLWQNQRDFQSYTTQFSETARSEFVTALTLTKLIDTRQGPVVLGEEMNLYASRDAKWFSTVAHEYGHVAVRQMSRARSVPTWFNEGIASVVQGGYENYQQRVHLAAQQDKLLSMDEMLNWGVDGNRAFLAYSQANSIVDYIVDRWGGRAVLQILRLIGNDMKPDDAFSTVLQLNQQQLWQEWRRDNLA